MLDEFGYCDGHGDEKLRRAINPYTRFLAFIRVVVSLLLFIDLHVNWYGFTHDKLAVLTRVIQQSRGVPGVTKKE